MFLIVLIVLSEVISGADASSGVPQGEPKKVIERFSAPLQLLRVALFDRYIQYHYTVNKLKICDTRYAIRDTICDTRSHRKCKETCSVNWMI